MYDRSYEDPNATLADYLDVAALLEQLANAQV